MNTQRGSPEVKPSFSSSILANLYNYICAMLNKKRETNHVVQKGTACFSKKMLTLANIGFNVREKPGFCIS